MSPFERALFNQMCEQASVLQTAEVKVRRNPSSQLRAQLREHWREVFADDDSSHVIIAVGGRKNRILVVGSFTYLVNNLNLLDPDGDDFHIPVTVWRIPPPLWNETRRTFEGAVVAPAVRTRAA